MTGASFAALFILLIITIQIRTGMMRPHINRRPWGVGSVQREAARLVVSLSLAVTAIYIQTTVAHLYGLLITVAAWAVTLSWLPGAIRQSVRLRRMPEELQEAASAILHERVPDLALLAVLVTPDSGDIPAWMHLERNARYLGDLPDAGVNAEDIPTLRRFIEATVFDVNTSRPFNSKPGRTKVLMNDYEMQTTLDLEFPDILQQVIRFVGLPKEQWPAVADSAMLYGVEAALAYVGIPVEYMDALAERRENIRLKW